MSLPRRFVLILLLLSVLLLVHQPAASAWQGHGNRGACASTQSACQEHDPQLEADGKTGVAVGAAAASDIAATGGAAADAAAASGAAAAPSAATSDDQTAQKERETEEPEREMGVSESEPSVTQSEAAIMDEDSSSPEAQAGVPEVNVTAMRLQVQEMFYHAYDGYKRFAFPQDELKPLSCSGSNPYGGMAMTLMESLGTLLLLGNVTEFNWGVDYLSQHLSFDLDIRVNVFEANIRALGSLLSAHVLILQSRDPTLPSVHPSLAGVHLAPGYNGRLLELAIDLGFRLLPAFSSGTPIPYAWVNLRRGVLPDEVTHTCTAGAGTLLLEFSVLSNLSGIPIFQVKAEAAVVALYRRRSSLNLVGNGISSVSGVWLQRESTAGAGVDSFFEYLLKGYLLLGKGYLRRMFSKMYSGAMRYMAVRGEPMVRWLLDVGMDNGHLGRHYASSLQAFWPAMQVIAGQTADARVIHSGLWAVWQKFSFLPELFSLTASAVHPVERGYPLRPEMAESAYFLFKATGNRTYLEIGREIAAALNTVTRTECGFASIGNVESHRLDNHMESFLLSETLKYLYLLFSPHIDIAARFVFSTEGHLLSLNLPRIFRVVCPSEGHPDTSPAGDCRVVAVAEAEADGDADAHAEVLPSSQTFDESQPSVGSHRLQSQPLPESQPSQLESQQPSFESRECQNSLAPLGSLVDQGLAARRQLACEAVVRAFPKGEHGGKGWEVQSGGLDAKSQALQPDFEFETTQKKSRIVDVDKGSDKGNENTAVGGEGVTVGSDKENEEGSKQKDEEGREEMANPERETRETREREGGREERVRRIKRRRERERQKREERQKEAQRAVQQQRQKGREEQKQRGESWRSPLEEEVSRIASFITYTEQQKEQQLAAAEAEAAGGEGGDEQGTCPTVVLDSPYPNVAGDAAAGGAAAAAAAGGAAAGDAGAGGGRLGGVVSRVVGNQRVLCYFMLDQWSGPSCFAWNALPAAFPYLLGFQTLTVNLHIQHKGQAEAPCVVRLVDFPSVKESSGVLSNVTITEREEERGEGEEVREKGGREEVGAAEFGPPLGTGGDDDDDGDGDGGADADADGDDNQRNADADGYCDGDGGADADSDGYGGEDDDDDYDDADSDVGAAAAASASDVMGRQVIDNVEPQLTRANPSDIGECLAATGADGADERDTSTGADAAAGADATEAVPNAGAAEATTSTDVPSSSTTSPSPSSVILGTLAEASPPEACVGRLWNPGEVEGRVAVVMRGGCSFQHKVLAAQAAGAAAVVVINHEMGGGAMQMAPDVVPVSDIGTPDGGATARDKVTDSDTVTPDGGATARDKVTDSDTVTPDGGATAPDKVTDSDTVTPDGGATARDKVTDSDTVTPDGGATARDKVTDSDTVTPDGGVVPRGEVPDSGRVMPSGGVTPGQGSTSQAAIAAAGAASGEGSEAAGEGSTAAAAAAETAEGVASRAAVLIPSVSLGNADGVLLLAVLRGQMSVREAARRKRGEAEGESEIDRGAESEGESEGERGAESEGEEGRSKQGNHEQGFHTNPRSGSSQEGVVADERKGGEGEGSLDGKIGKVKLWVKLFCPRRREEEDRPVLFDVDVSVPPQSPLQMQQAINAMLMLLRSGQINRLLPFA
ncbi:hypothetical protein CLOM_g11871 [Closterium sp. NIES-68]|nr:hypothetical protein CLOM_g11871 [Closterium sp. NIES-68]